MKILPAYFSRTYGSRGADETRQRLFSTFSQIFGLCGSGGISGTDEGSILPFLTPLRGNWTGNGANFDLDQEQHEQLVQKAKIGCQLDPELWEMCLCLDIKLKVRSHP